MAELNSPFSVPSVSFAMRGPIGLAAVKIGLKRQQLWGLGFFTSSDVVPKHLNPRLCRAALASPCRVVAVREW